MKKIILCAFASSIVITLATLTHANAQPPTYDVTPNGDGTYTATPQSQCYQTACFCMDLASEARFDFVTHQRIVEDAMHYFGIDYDKTCKGYDAWYARLKKQVDDEFNYINRYNDLGLHSTWPSTPYDYRTPAQIARGCAVCKPD
jgi:hypothetical protein